MDPQTEEHPLQHGADIRVGDKKTIRAWVMYDWANSAFQLTIATAIFPIFYAAVTSYRPDNTVDFLGFTVLNQALYSWTIAAAYLLIAILSPLFSSFADFTGRRKSFMKVFTWIGSAACILLYFFDGHHIAPGIFFFWLATVGYSGSIVFYNSFLPIIAAPADQDKVSARGFSMGYLGGVVLIIINLLVIQEPLWFGFPMDSDLPARISFITVGLWWIGFAQITFRHLPKYTYGKRVPGADILLNGYRELHAVFSQLRRSRSMVLFLFGYFFMMAGLATMMYMSVPYGKQQLHVSDDVLIPTVILIQLVAMGGAWIFSRLSGKIGNFRTLIVTVIIWVGTVIYAYNITGATGFIIAAMFVGLVMGGTQSLSRSTYSKLLPETTDHTSFFSFYDVMEKTSSVLGLFSFGALYTFTGNMRTAVLSIGLYFILGLIFLLFLVRRVD